MTDTSTPYVPPPDERPRYVIRPLSWRSPFRWLALGARDVWTQPAIALFYGACFWLMLGMLMWVFRSLPEYTMTMISGFLLAGPFLVMGLHEVSRRRELGLEPDLASSLTCWDAHIPSMGMLVLVLIVLELLWGRASLVVFAVFFNTGMPSTAGVMQAVFNPENWEFLAVYLLVGSVFAGLLYGMTAISLPMILDRDTDAVSAVIASLQLMLTRTPVMLVWAVLLLLIFSASLLPWGAGLLLTGPWLGHAAWHGYRDAVQWLDAAAAPGPSAAV